MDTSLPSQVEELSVERARNGDVTLDMLLLLSLEHHFLTCKMESLDQIISKASSMST